jgi:hypothetical protein
MLRALAVIAAIICCRCDLFQKAAADKVLVVTWLDAPAITTPPFNQLANFGTTTVTAVFASKGVGNPTPIHGGFTAFFGAGKKVDLTETSVSGTYAATSHDNPILIYDDNPQHRYGFIACKTSSADACVGEEYDINSILAAPRLDRDTIEFSPLLGATTLPGFDGSVAAGQALIVEFPPPPANDQYRPFVTVFGQKSDGTVGQVYSSLPAQASDYLQFINSTPPKQVTIPGSALASGPYVVLAVSARLSLDTSTNLFIGSGALAGAASAFVIVAQ